MRSLVDAGNLFASLISEELANTLHLEVQGEQRTIGTAERGGEVTVLGQVKGLRIVLEDCLEPLYFEPFVVRNLSHHINLGQDFLRRFRCKMDFQDDQVSLSLGTQILPLIGRSEPLLQSSGDPRFAPEFLDNASSLVGLKDDLLMVPQEPRQAPVVPPQTVEMAGTHYNAAVQNAIIIPAQTKQQITISTKLRAENVYFEPKVNSNILNEKEMFFVKGFYVNKNGLINVWVMNLSNVPQRLDRNTRVGKCFMVNSPPVVQAGQVNTLGHQAPETLTPAEVQERVDFLKQELELDKNELLNEYQREQVLEVFLSNFDSVSIGGDDFGNSNLIKFNIQLVPDAVPHRAKCRPLNPMQEQDLKRQLDEWLSAGIIEPSCSEWSAALVPCKKKGTDKLRWSCDFRALNKMTVKDSFPLPCIETNLDKLKGARFFSSLDSAGAYHAIGIDRKSRDLTTFVSTYGTYRFCRMPFGLSNSPAAYCRLVQMALSYLPPGFCLAYLDDVLVYSKTFDEHLDHLRQVVELHSRVGMKLNLRKCKIFKNEVDYLGFHVSAGGISMVPDYVRRITEWPVPTTGTELQSFLGVANYYRSFIPEFSGITACLNKLRNVPKFELTETEMEAMNKLKHAFTVAPLRAYPDYYSPEPFILSVDYSKLALAGILTQVQGGVERFIGAFSKACDSAEKNYAAHKGEAAAIIYSLRKFEHILRAKKFIIRTDSQALTFMNSLKEARGIWARWNVYLSSFNFDIIHRAGKENICADALSRVEPTYSSSDEEKYRDDPLADVEDIYAIENPEIGKVWSEQVSKEDWIRYTRLDYDITLVKSFVQNKQTPTREERRRMPYMSNQLFNRFQLLSVEDELLWYNSPIRGGVLRPARVVVPTALQDRIVAAAHRQVTAHAGTTETYTKLRERCYFPGMFDKTRIFVHNCVECLQKTNKLGKNRHVRHREILSYPFQRIFLDTVGPLNPCRHGGVVYRHILTILDGFTRWFTAIPIPNLESSTILTAFQEQFIYRFGVPEVVHCDRGSSFMSRNFTLSLQAMSIGLTHAPVYSPDANKVERFHKTLGQLLRADDSAQPGAWVGKLNALVFGINTAVCAPTQVSPYYAMFGRNPRLPIDVLFPFPHLNPSVDWTEHVIGVNRKFQTISKSLTQLECQQLAYNNEIKAPRLQYNFNVGDLVYYFTPRSTPGVSRKLTCRWSGPFSIVKTVSDSLSVIFPLGTWMDPPKEISALNSRLRRMAGAEESAIIPIIEGPGSVVESDIESETGIIDILDIEIENRGQLPGLPAGIRSATSRPDSPGSSLSASSADLEDPLAEPHEYGPHVDPREHRVSDSIAPSVRRELVVKSETTDTVPSSDGMVPQTMEPTMVNTDPWSPTGLPVPLAVRRLGTPPDPLPSRRPAAEQALARLGDQLAAYRRPRKPKT